MIGKKSMIVKKICSLLAVIAFSAAVSSCGSASNNDQGASFLNLGFFSESTCSTGLAGFPVNSPQGNASGVFGSNSGGVIQTAFIQFENRLSEQFIRVSRIDCAYEVPGATISIPSGTFAISGILDGRGFYLLCTISCGWGGN